MMKREMVREDGKSGRVKAHGKRQGWGQERGVSRGIMVGNPHRSKSFDFKMWVNTTQALFCLCNVHEGVCAFVCLG